MEKKELTRFELAIVKRTAQNTKSLRNKRDKLVDKINKAQEELNIINETIDSTTKYSTPKAKPHISLWFLCFFPVI